MTFLPVHSPCSCRPVASPASLRSFLVDKPEKRRKFRQFCSSAYSSTPVAAATSRFVESFKRKFVAHEIESLKERTVAGTSGQLCECLLARADENGQQVIGCIDIRVPRLLAGKHPVGVPEDDDKGAYILNVVVEEYNRGRGVGKALMREAMSRAVNVWQAENLYTHVEADNEVALHLYLTCGFEEHSSSSRFGTSVSLGKLILLKASATMVKGQT